MNQKSSQGFEQASRTLCCQKDLLVSDGQKDCGKEQVQGDWSQMSDDSTLGTRGGGEM